jgi:hypothetical protein
MAPSEGKKLKHAKFYQNLGFRVAYVAAVIKNCDPDKGKGSSEDSVKPLVSKWRFSAQDLAHLVTDRDSLYVNTWAGLEVVRNHVDKGQCKGGQ